MRQGHFTLRPAHVHARARALLVGRLRLSDYNSSIPAVLLASLLIIAALSNSSLCCACSLHPEHPCYQSARNALHANLKDKKQATLLNFLLDALLDGVPDWLLRAPLPCAIDLHQRCFYGKKGTKGTTRGKSKKGTNKFFTYATLAVLSPEGRFTLGLLPVHPKQLLQNTVGRLLEQAARAGLSIDYLMLDREFGSAEVITLLKRQSLRFLIAAQKHGKKQGTGNRRFFEADCRLGWHEHSWTTPKRVWDFKEKKRKERGKQTAELDVCVAGGTQKRPRLVYYAWGLRSWSVAQVKGAYRRRFGIETGYRQLGQCLAQTSSRDHKVRLLLVGVALVLLNAWAQLHCELLASGPRGKRQPRLYLLRLTILRILVLLEILRPCETAWQTQQPIPDAFTSMR